MLRIIKNMMIQVRIKMIQILNINFHYFIEHQSNICLPQVHSEGQSLEFYPKNYKC